jgi:hypothetical protein
MKMLTPIVGLTAMVISAPAFAEPPEFTPGNSISTGAGDAMSSRAQAPDPYGYSPAPSEDKSPHSSNPSADPLAAAGREAWPGG